MHHWPIYKKKKSYANRKTLKCGVDLHSLIRRLSIECILFWRAPWALIILLWTLCPEPLSQVKRLVRGLLFLPWSGTNCSYRLTWRALLLGAFIVSFLGVLHLQDTKLITYIVNSLPCFEICMQGNEHYKHM